jgi:hypothetical protein
MIILLATYSLVILASMIINRLAGGGYPVDQDFIKNTPLKFLFGRIQCGAYIGLVSYLIFSWEIAVIAGLGFYFWRLFSWGFMIRGIAGEEMPDRDANPVEGFLSKTFGYTGGMFVRMLFIAPMLIVIGFLVGNYYIIALSIPFAFFATLCYVLSSKYTPKHIIGVAELGVGVLWGILLVLISMI